MQIEINKTSEGSLSKDQKVIKIGGIQDQIREIKDKFKKLKTDKITIKHAISKPELIPYSKLKTYEFYNLIRLGLVKVIYKSYAFVDTKNIPVESDYFNDDPNLYLQDLEIEIETTDDDYIMTELGELFINVCTEKKKVTSLIIV